MKIHILSLGCARTLVDSEGLGGLLAAEGHAIADKPERADCVVVNTCAFIREAEEESVSTILDLAALKKAGKIRHLVVAGCLPQKRKGEREDLLAHLPEVDGFIGPGDLPKLPALIREWNRPAAAPADRFFVTSPVPTLIFDAKTPKHRLTPKHFAFLKVSEGCDHACAFCSIPQYRGPHRSRSIEDLTAEAERLASEGVVELNLIGQDSSYYGMDRYGKLALPDLLTALGRVRGIRWVRILYAHPAHVTDELVRAIRETPNVVPYIDIPIQHIADRILTRMKRETDGARIRAIVAQLRREIPGIAIRTTFIAGFPGETEGEVDQLAAFLREARFERVGIFPYRVEPKTAAEKMTDGVPERTIQKRLDRLMTLQREISRENNAAWVGRTVEVLVEEPGGEPGLFLGRTRSDAPEVDGQVFLHGPRNLKPGRFVEARVTGAEEYDLTAETLPASVSS
ncbi:MAG: 30S ribosomal protein S12 methylthiotransferase RimO [Candidatus Omnitrophica bacterium CG11_big_fil_rev_8_21_14_0_20_64_10]|nr:MAG: 30S ribosomal protein S12 methylthiotransferase RimO [Candidatus Omnitrophica bacterium CG11_big_fil_rev_8_21_14_0_20_64_10]